jgi:Fe-coproporphyrin III synthase
MNSLDLQILKDTTARYLRNRAEKRRTGLYPLDMLLLYVTMRCNAKCDHCFCWEDLNVGIPEMTLEQMEALAESIPPVGSIIMTGGEPTLRKDLVEVVTAFGKRGKVKTVYINSNGLKPDLIESLARRIKAECPDVGLDFQISIDGLQETHDRIRGVPGNFEKAMETLRRVFALRGEFPALSGHALTVITELNYRELIPLNDYLKEAIAPDIIHGFELVRDVEKSAWGDPG